MFEPHEGTVQLAHTYQQAYAWLVQHGPVHLQTGKGTGFEARVGQAIKGAHRGEPAIHFLQHGQNYARAYDCCWGHYYNCYRTRIGMYCAALDAAVG